MKEKYFSRRTKAERIHRQQIFTIRNVKGGPSGRKKMMPDENLELHQGMKHHGNANYMGQYKRFFLII